MADLTSNEPRCAGVGPPPGRSLPGDHIGCDHDFRCICDPADLFDPPDPRPRAVEGCPAHRIRRIAQQFATAFGS